MSIQRSIPLLAALLLLLTAFATGFAEEPPTTTAIEEPALDESDREYWAYQRVVRPAIPELEDDQWSKNAIDKFVLAKLREQQLQPVEFADRLTLLRRVTYNLTGLPPTPEEIVNFLSDENEDAYQKLLSRLLDSTAYGERWSQHWLDLVRFAETDGFEHDKTRPQAWRYRDWVIQAFNDDLPYDEFVSLQIAGDEISPDSEDAVLATGYLLAGPDMPDINLQNERRHIFLNGMTANVGEVFLGLRFGCAQCHHHRTDPISQHDFYRLRSFFETINLFKDQTLDVTIGTEKNGAAKKKQLPVRVVRNKDHIEAASHLWIRGDFRRPGPQLSPQFPRVLTSSSEAKSIDDENKGRRQALAELIVHRDNPLTARVIVNRIWQHHFGVGLISTPSDFGWMGESATHPELLDWLAAEFMESGWSMKRLHRLILSSSTYQLASFASPNATPEQLEAWENLRSKDRFNTSLGRRKRQRLEGEAIRDAMLSISGELNRKRGGPGVRPPLPPAVASTLLKNQWPVTKDKSEHTRRSVYLFARRNLRLPMLEAFDKPDANLSCPQRSQTTIAPQALHLLNSEFARVQSKAFAKRVTSSSPQQAEQIQYAYLLVLGRPPTKSEIRACQQFLASASDSGSNWPNLCHALFNLNEFVYVD